MAVPEQRSGVALTGSMRPFAPNDFRRERKITTSHQTPSKKTPGRAPPAASSTRLDGSASTSEATHESGSIPLEGIFRHRSLDIKPQLASGSVVPDAEQNNDSDRSVFKEWQDEADREWQSLRERRRSSTSVTIPCLPTALAKSSLSPSSSFSFTNLGTFEQRRASHSPERGRPTHAKEAEDDALRETQSSSVDSNPMNNVGKRITPSPLDGQIEQVRSRTLDSIMHRERHSVGSAARSPTQRSSFDAMQRARSIMSVASSRLSSGADSTMALLREGGMGRDSEDSALETADEAPRRPNAARRHTSTVPLNLPSVTFECPDSTNWLSNDEKMEQLKRSQKLASLLGDEWWRCTHGQHGDRELNDEFRSATTGPAGKASLLRRRSDPLHLQQSFKTLSAKSKRRTSDADGPPSSDDSEKSVAKMASARWKALHSKRSRSSTNLMSNLMSDPASGSTNRSSAVFPLSPLPLDIHPKAAALLGLCTMPPTQQVCAGTASQAALAAEDSGEAGQRDADGLSSSSIEMLRDSDPMLLEDQERKVWLDPGHTEPLSNLVQSMKEGDDDESSLEMIDTTLSREERRRRVMKISRWLGAAVPPHLVRPNPDPLLSQQKAASGYGLDEAPPSPLTDYMSGCPLSTVEKSRSPVGNLANPISSVSKPLTKARTVMNAKLKGKTSSDASDRATQFTTSRPSLELVHSNTDVSMALTQEERMTNVKRNYKLTSVFGEAPPTAIIKVATQTSKGQGEDRSGHNPDKISQSRAKHSMASGLKNDSHLHSLEGLVAAQSSGHWLAEGAANIDEGEWKRFSDRSSEARRSDNFQIRKSLDSLEYLIEKRSPLLNNLIATFEEDDCVGLCLRENAAHQDDPQYGSFGKANNEDSHVSSIGMLQGSSHHVADDRISIASSLCTKSDRSITDSSEESRKHELNVRRHQKLGRWFGETLPSAEQTHSQLHRIKVPTSKAKHTHAKSDILPLNPEAGQPVVSIAATRSGFNRMAPRSAGSARRPRSHSRALGNILNTIEGELVDDDEITRLEKAQLQERLGRLRQRTQAALFSDQQSRE